MRRESTSGYGRMNKEGEKKGRGRGRRGEGEKIISQIGGTSPYESGELCKVTRESNRRRDRRRIGDWDSGSDREKM